MWLGVLIWRIVSVMATGRGGGSEQIFRMLLGIFEGHSLLGCGSQCFRRSINKSLL